MKKMLRNTGLNKRDIYYSNYSPALPHKGPKSLPSYCSIITQHATLVCVIKKRSQTCQSFRQRKEERGEYRANNFILVSRAEVVPIASTNIALMINQSFCCLQQKETGRYNLQLGSHMSSKRERTFVGTASSLLHQPRKRILADRF